MPLHLSKAGLKQLHNIANSQPHESLSLPKSSWHTQWVSDSFRILYSVGHTIFQNEVRYKGQAEHNVLSQMFYIQPRPASNISLFGIKILFYALLHRCRGTSEILSKTANPALVGSIAPGKINQAQKVFQSKTTTNWNQGWYIPDLQHLVSSA